MKRIALLSLVLALPGCGWFGGDDSPTAPPPPACETPTLTCSPLAGAPGVYTCEVAPAGEWTPVVNGADRPLEHGVIVVASAGDEVQACRACGCSRIQELR